LTRPVTVLYQSSALRLRTYNGAELH